MNSAIVGLYGIFLIFVGLAHNAPTLKDKVSGDLKEFLPWVLAILILNALYSNDTLKPFVKPFIGLAILTFVLRNYSTIISQINLIGGLKLPN